MNDYNILALGWLEKKCHFGTKLRRNWCHFGTMRWRLGLAFRCSSGRSHLQAGLASVFATWARFCLPVVRVIGLAFRCSRGRSHLQACLASNSPPDCSPTAKLRALLCRFKQKTQSRGLGFPFDTATWARTKDLLLRRQLLYPTELLPHAQKYRSFFTDLCKGETEDCRNNGRQPKS